MHVIEKSYQGGGIDVDVINKAIVEIKDVIKQWKDAAILVYTPEDIMYRAKDRKVFIPYMLAIMICSEIQKHLVYKIVDWNQIDKLTDFLLQEWSEQRSA